MHDLIEKLAPTWFGLLKSAVKKFNMDMSMRDYCNPLEFDAMMLFGFNKCIVDGGIFKHIDKGRYRLNFNDLIRSLRSVDSDSANQVINRYSSYISDWAKDPNDGVWPDSHWQIPSVATMASGHKLTSDSKMFDDMLRDTSFQERYVADIEASFVRRSLTSSESL